MAGCGVWIAVSIRLELSKYLTSQNNYSSLFQYLSYSTCNPLDSSRSPGAMFSDTSRNISYDTNTGILSAQCQTDDKQWRNSWLNINDCLLWQNPKIVPYKGRRETYEGNLSLVTYLDLL